MKSLHLSIIVLIVFSGTSFAFAQEYLRVAPFDPNYFHTSECPHLSINTPSDLNSNYARTTLVDYSGTKLISTLVQGKINYTEWTGTAGSGPPFIYDITNSTSFISNPLQKTSLGFNATLSEEDIIFNSSYSKNPPVYFTQALTNIGNKTITIIKPNFDDLSVIVINYKNGTSVYSHHDSFASFGYEYGSLVRPPLDSVELKPNHSLLTYVYSLEPSPRDHTHFTTLSPDNYTMTSVARFIGNVDGKCTMVYLWSQPVDLTVLPEEKVPEFPFAIPVLLISIVSIIVFYRIKFGALK